MQWPEWLFRELLQEKKVSSRAGEMAQQLKSFAVKPEDQSLIPIVE